MKYSTVNIDDISIFYRECGDASLPTLLLLHGFPSSSHQFRNLMPLLEKNFHVVAPDYPGFGYSSAPLHETFEYSFANLTNYIEKFLENLHIESYFMYVFDYGAPIGFRLALHNPESILGIFSQNGNIYNDGLGPKWSERAQYWSHPTADLRKKYETAFARDTVIGQYLTGEEPGMVGPDGYTFDLHFAEREGYNEIQNDLIFDYQSNVKLYPQFQEYVREYQPKIIAAWGKNDPSFIFDGALAFQRDAPQAVVIALDGGHFVIESHYEQIAQLLIENFSDK